MANKKISELPYINGGKISGNTLVPLVTYFSAATGDTVHTFVEDFQTYLISGLTGNTDVFVTGGTYSAGTITFTNNTGGTFNVTGLTTGSTSIISGEYLPLSGGTVTGSTEFTAGLSANTISATTYLNLPITTDVFVTGGTYSNGDATFTNNTGGTFNVTGFYTGETSYVNSLTTGVGLSADTTTGDITIINTDPDQVVTLNNGTNINVTGTYPNFTIDVTGLTDFNTYTTGFTYSNNTFTILDNSGNTFDATFTEVTGLTVNGDLNITGTVYSNIISATTYQNLPDNVTGNYLPLSGGTVTGQTFFTSGVSISGSVETSGSQVYHRTDVFVVENQTINGSLIEATNSGVNIWSTNTYLSIDAENRQLIKSDGSTISFDWENGILTGQTNIGSSTISATTYLNLPITTDVFVTGGTYSAGTSTFTNNTGGTFSVSGFVTGDTYVTGLTFNTGNYNLTIGRNDGVSFTDSLSILASDLTVTGGTYDPNTGVATFTNNTGGTFNVTGFLTGFTDTFVTGGTYSNGTATFTNTSGGTFNVSGFYTGGTDVFVTGGTFSAGTATFTNNTGGTFSVTGITSSSGPFGISNSAGTYTYYSTLQSAMSAATTGQVIEMFADVTDTTGTPVTLKPNITIQGNGHTYLHTSTTGDTFTVTTTGTYRFMNLIIKRTVTTPTGAFIFNNVGATFYQGYTMIFQNTSVEYTWTTSTGATPFIAPSTNVCFYYIDGIRALANGSGVMFGGNGAYVQIIKNSVIENTGTGGCFSSDNITGGSYVENSHLKTNSGNVVVFSYAGQGDAIRNSTVITTSGIGVSGGFSYDTSSFSNTNRAFSSTSCYNCVGQTASGNAYYNSTIYNSTGVAATGIAFVPFFPGTASISNSYLNSSGNITVYDADYSSQIYNSTIICGYNNAAGHAISLSNTSVVIVNSYISVTNASANCIKGTSPINAKYTNNVFAGATTPVNANITQSIINTQDNQGNILI